MKLRRRYLIEDGSEDFEQCGGVAGGYFCGVWWSDSRGGGAVAPGGDFAGGGESAGGCSAAAAGLGRGLTKDEVDAIAVTHTPGLMGSLLIGTLTARMLAILWGKPLYATHHLKVAYLCELANK